MRLKAAFNQNWFLKCIIILIRRLVGLVEKDRGLVLSVCLWTQFYRLVKSSTGNTQQIYFFFMLLFFLFLLFLYWEKHFIYKNVIWWFIYLGLRRMCTGKIEATLSPTRKETHYLSSIIYSIFIIISSKTRISCINLAK